MKLYYKFKEMIRPTDSVYLHRKLKTMAEEGKLEKLGRGVLEVVDEHVAEVIALLEKHNAIALLPVGQSLKKREGKEEDEEENEKVDLDKYLK